MLIAAYSVKWLIMIVTIWYLRQIQVDVWNDKVVIISAKMVAELVTRCGQIQPETIHGIIGMVTPGDDFATPGATTPTEPDAFTPAQQRVLEKALNLRLTELRDANEVRVRELHTEIARLKGATSSSSNMVERAGKPSVYDPEKTTFSEFTYKWKAYLGLLNSQIGDSWKRSSHDSRKRLTLAALTRKRSRLQRRSTIPW